MLAASLFVAFIADLLLGDPRWLYHPVVLIGNMISYLEKIFRSSRFFTDSRATMRLAGIIIVFVVISTAFLLPLILLYAVFRISLPLALGLNMFWSYQVIAVKSLKEAALDVVEALEEGGLEAGRRKLAMIVGRDTQELSETEILKATVETVAENTTDGIAAPMLSIAVFGAPLGLAYKAVNTMDSMIGYKDERYIDIGRAAAIIDDVANFIPARITAFFIVAAAFLQHDCSGIKAFRIFRRDRNKHASPNSGQTEAAVAGALGIELAGDAAYFGKIYRKPTIGDAVRDIEREDVKRCCSLMYKAASIAMVFSVALSMVIYYVFAGRII